MPKYKYNGIHIPIRTKLYDINIKKKGCKETNG